jgi:hypothetical protein
MVLLKGKRPNLFYNLQPEFTASIAGGERRSDLSGPCLPRSAGASIRLHRQIPEPESEPESEPGLPFPGGKKLVFIESSQGNPRLQSGEELRFRLAIDLDLG